MNSFFKVFIAKYFLKLSLYTRITLPNAPLPKVLIILKSPKVNLVKLDGD